MADFSLSEEATSIREEVRRFARATLRERGRAAEVDPASVEDLRTSFYELGLVQLDWPEELGGLGLGLFERVLVSEELAYGDAGLALLLDDAGLAARALLELGSAEQQQRWLAPWAGDQAPGQVWGLALDEADLAWERGALFTMASREDDLWRLMGAKYFVLQAPRASHLVVFARTGFEPGWPGIDAFVVPARGEGLSLEVESNRLGLGAVSSARVLLSGCTVPESARLCGADDKLAAVQRLLAYRRIVAAAHMLGVARAALEYACGYAEQRPAFGRMIGQFQSIAFKLADLATEIDATRWLTWQAASLFDEGSDFQLASLQALIQAQETAHRAGIDSVQVLGGAGFIDDYPVEKFMRDGAALASLSGSRLVVEELAAEQLFGTAP